MIPLPALFSSHAAAALCRSRPLPPAGNTTGATPSSSTTSGRPRPTPCAGRMVPLPPLPPLPAQAPSAVAMMAARQRREAAPPPRLRPRRQASTVATLRAARIWVARVRQRAMAQIWRRRKGRKGTGTRRTRGSTRGTWTSAMRVWASLSASLLSRPICTAGHTRR